MMFRFADAGLTAVLMLVMISSGCGTMAGRDARRMNELPVSNTRIVEQAVFGALEMADLPEGAGERIRLEFEGEEDAKSFLSAFVPGFMKRLGYDVFESDADAAVVLVRVDTIAVSLNIQHRLFGSDRVLRRSDVGLTLTKRDRDGLRRVYRGSSVVNDEFPADYIPATGNDKTFVTIHDNGSTLSGNLGKPLVLGFTMTALAWLLYAYRG